MDPGKGAGKTQLLALIEFFLGFVLHWGYFCKLGLLLQFCHVN